jgi:hypothetical protein
MNNYIKCCLDDITALSESIKTIIGASQAAHDKAIVLLLTLGKVRVKSDCNKCRRHIDKD